MFRTIALCVAVLAAAPAHAFSIEFDWAGLKSCKTGRPNKVGAPGFVIKDLPKGTQSVVFKLVDLNVSNFRHGGGTVNLSGSGKMRPGAFNYLSPCPPGQVHIYEWTATAKSEKNGKGKSLGAAKAKRKYPE